MFCLLCLLSPIQKSKTLIQRTAAPRFTAFLWPVLLFPPVFGGTWGWTGHLSVFFFAVQWLADGGFPGSHCSVGGSEAICSLLCVFAQSASLCLSIVCLPPQCQMLMETSSRAPLACSEGCHSVCTMPDSCLLLFVSETAQRSHAGLQMYCIFSCMCVTAVAMRLLLPVGTWWGHGVFLC